VKSRDGSQPMCVICGKGSTLEFNHAAGRNHIPWFKIPFCKPHHDQFHRLLESVGLDLRNTPNTRRRLVIAALALTIALWMVLQALAEAVSLFPEKRE
jgi:hypothetical protein